MALTDNEKRVREIYLTGLSLPEEWIEFINLSDADQLSILRPFASELSTGAVGTLSNLQAEYVRLATEKKDVYDVVSDERRDPKPDSGAQGRNLHPSRST